MKNSHGEKTQFFNTPVEHKEVELKMKNITIPEACEIAMSYYARYHITPTPAYLNEQVRVIIEAWGKF